MRSTSKASFRIMFVFLLAVALAEVAQGQGAAVHARFELGSPQGGPFPSDRFTVPDGAQNTGLRVNMPVPDCAVRRSDCEDLAVINTLDGFNLQPRLSIPFDTAIDVSTVNSETVFLISLGSTVFGSSHPGKVVGINQIVWDTFTNTLHVKSDELLDQHTRYALIVTSGLRGESGDPVQATEAFQYFRERVQGSYRQALLDAIAAAKSLGIRESDIVTASVFTTQSATTILEKIRDQIKATIPAPTNFNLGPGEKRTVFQRPQVTKITFLPQTRANPPGFPPNPTDVPVNLLDIIPGAVGTIAFGKYQSPDYEVHPGEYMPVVATRTGVPQAQGTSDIYFNLFLPSGPKPACGWPVGIFGHGAGNNKNNAAFGVAASMAARGIATIAINGVGHGFGPLGMLTVDQADGGSVTLPAGGRGITQSPPGTKDAPIGAQEGMSATPPREILRVRDGFRQTAVDLMQLVRAIEVGMDVDGDGIPDLDSSRIYYLGHSQAGMYGTLFLAVEPNVRVASFTSAGVALPFITLGNARGGVHGAALRTRVPSLINAPGITRIDGVAFSGVPFHENVPLRDGVPLTVILEDGTTQVIQSPVINTVEGAIAIQEVLENMEWAFQSANLVAYAAHLRKSPLTSVPAKSVIYNYAKGDQAVPNPLMTALLRAGDLADRATFYRNDLAVAEERSVPRNPHNYAYAVDSPNTFIRAIALGAQDQIAAFFESDGTVVTQPEPARLFEVPINGQLREELNFIPDP